MTVTTEITSNGIALVTVDNPPVNAISQAVRQGLWDAFASVSEDTSVQAVVLHCVGRTFMAGADASELGKPPVPPHLNDLVVHIESCPKPIVAAIHGQALGGGLEIALACSHRIATASAKMGLPEVTLGFVPGAGGTQHLPRLIGVEAALNMAVDGKPINAKVALEKGLIDRIADDLDAEALAFATELAGSDVSARKLNQPMAADAFDAGLFDAWRARYAKRKPGLLAPQAVIDAVEAATGPDFTAGLAKERELSLTHRKHPQSTALRHIFFAERASLKADGIDLKSAGEINSVAVIGAGTMGAGIAQFFAMNGTIVKLVEISDEAAQAGVERIRGNLAASVKRGKLSEAKAEAVLADIAPTTDYADLADVDLVIEAAVENMEIKKQIFAKLDDICRKDAILSSNTSYLDLNDLAQSTKHPQRVVGLHFFSPAHVMKLVEIVQTENADPMVMSTLAATMRKMGKIGVIAGVCHGFIGNRIYQAYQREAGRLMMEVGDPARVDAALRKFGMAMGPFQVLDLSGIDIGYLMRRALPEDAKTPAADPVAFGVHDALVEQAMKGRKTGRGFYDYSGDTPVVNSAVVPLVIEKAKAAGIEPSDITDEEIAERCIAALAREGEELLKEGIAAKSGDIDVVFVNGYGFPRHKGGPMHHAKVVAAKNGGA